MSIRRMAAFLLSVVFVISACGGGAATTAPTAAAPTDAPTDAPTSEPTAAARCIVGVSWNNFQEPRWAKFDQPAIKAAVEAAGGTYIFSDAKSSAEAQATDVENLISQGANALIILAQDGTAIIPSVQSAISQGIPVVSYDRLIEDPGALYLSFDNVEVGRMEARAVYAAVPKGNYVIIKGNSADANADFLRAGMEEIIGAAVASGDIKIVGESYTDNWDPAIAQTNMENFLTAANNDVQAVLAENDGMAGGVISALAAQGLAGKVAVSGQDGDAAGLVRVAQGTQTVDVWKDSGALGKTAGEAAMALCANPDLASVPGTAPFTSPGGNALTSIILPPTPITKDNLNLVLEAGVIDAATLCQGVTAGSVAVCP